METNCENKKNLRVCVSGGHREGNDPFIIEECYKMGKLIVKMGFCLDYGFSNSGVMGAVARGVLDAFNDRKEDDYENVAPIVGVTTKEYYELYEKDEFLEQISEVVLEDTLENRKKKLLAADIVVFAPGGVGTLDELAYDCVAMQDGFLKNKPFILYNINGFFFHILEALKELASNGFASKMPFIVVDDSSELEIAFRLLKLKYNNCADNIEAYLSARQLAYSMPYFIKMQLDTGMRVEELIEETDRIQRHGTKQEKEHLLSSIEEAYLEKEIERMYDRLSKTGRDTAKISDKLTKFKRRKKTIS
ncbi:MAG: LOG family protein [Alphaproteobacteria bacterium]|nr:LOG family protein [Alphaproteobacteria bacterium]